MDSYNQGQTAVRAAPPTVNPSIFGAVEFAASNAASAANRVEQMVDRLCGSVPKPANAERPSAVSNGLMEEGTRQAESIAESAARINAAMDRLEKSLP